MSFYADGICRQPELPAEITATIAELRRRVDSGELETLDVEGLAEFERELNGTRSPFPLPFDHPHNAARNHVAEALRAEKLRRQVEQSQRIVAEQSRYNAAQSFVHFAMQHGIGIAAIVDEFGLDVYGKPLAKPAKVSAKAAADMTDGELMDALNEARAIVLDQRRERCAAQADAISELARVAFPISKRINEMAEAYDARHDAAARNAEVLEKELARRDEERASAEAERAKLDADLPKVVAELQRQIDELRARNEQ